MSEIRLDLLNPIDLIEQKSTSEILNEIGGANTSAANPEGRVYRGWALREHMFLKKVDSGLKGNILAFAKGKELDYIGETYYRNSDGSKILRKKGESDESYRLALQESPEGLTSAGTLKSYNFHASRAHTLVDINKVNSKSLSPMEMTIFFISDDDHEDEIKEAIEKHLIPFAPGGDSYSAIRATKRTGVINATVKCDRGVGLDLLKKEGMERLNNYTSSLSKIGIIASYSSISTALTVPGVNQVLLSGWTDIECSYNEYPEITSVRVVYEHIT